MDLSDRLPALHSISVGERLGELALFQQPNLSEMCNFQNCPNMDSKAGNTLLIF